LKLSKGVSRADFSRVGVQSLREPAIGALDALERGVAWNPKKDVVVLAALHRSYTIGRGSDGSQIRTP